VPPGILFSGSFAHVDADAAQAWLCLGRNRHKRPREEWALGGAGRKQAANGRFFAVPATSLPPAGDRVGQRDLPPAGRENCRRRRAASIRPSAAGRLSCIFLGGAGATAVAGRLIQRHLLSSGRTPRGSNQGRVFFIRRRFPYAPPTSTATANPTHSLPPRPTAPVLPNCVRGGCRL